MAPQTTADRDADEIMQSATLGHLRLRHIETNEILLIPTPSRDPNDPLNWSQPYKVYLAVTVCLAIFMCNFLAAGPSVAIVDITYDFTGATPADPGFTAAVSKVSYGFTAAALLQGCSNWWWMPLILKFGRRPLYIFSFAGYFAVILWAGFAKTWSSVLAARIFLGALTGTAEAMAPLTMSDLFFLHERGRYMAIYTAFLSAGVSGGVIISGLVTINLSWRYIYYVAGSIVGALLILVIFTFPETAYVRDTAAIASENDAQVKQFERPSDNGKESLRETRSECLDLAATTPNINDRHVPKKKGFVENMAIFNGTFVKESVWVMFYRPVLLLAAPAVLWATLAMAVTIGFLVAITSNFATAFNQTYGFLPYQAGLCFISGFTGTFLGIFFGGSLSDKIADFFTRRNNGLREPEHRLPAAAIGTVCSPLGLILYGVGINNQLHWMVPTLGLGFLSFAISQATNVSLVYAIDSYRPIAGETIVTQLAFKSLFGFLLSFYTNPWIAKSGYAAAFGEMAAISGAVLILWVPLFFWGSKVRSASMKWGIMRSLLRWGEDREVGE